jgi:DNA repair exonuclease SbcCD nuclease subunit
MSAATAKLLHLAGAHLGSTVWGRSRVQRTRLRDALETALMRAVEYAVREDVDAVLVAGDLYDAEHLSLNLEKFLVEQIQRLHEAGLPVVAVAGATDADDDGLVGPDSFYRIGSDDAEIIDLRDAAAPAPLRVIGKGHPAGEDFAVSAEEADVPTVGLLYAPELEVGTEETELPEAKVAYWALGGAHRRGCIASDPAAWQAGSLMGRWPDEPGPRGGLLVTVQPNEPPDVAPRDFAPLTWKTLRFRNLEDVDTRDGLRRRVLERLPARRGSLMLRLVLEGPCPLASTLADPDQRRAWEEPLANRLGVVAVCLDASDLVAATEPEPYRDETHVLAETLELMDASEEELYDLRPDLLAGRPEDMDRRAYLGELLRGLDREAVEQLLAVPNETSSAA